jgi:glycosyltransferase involved in cell wall biosynthesis
MKLAHIAIATPRMCGLYETTRELVYAERTAGVDARIVDPKPHDTVGITGEDRGVPISDWEWAVTADYVISHSGHDRTPIAETNQPIVIAAHGRPISTFIGERNGQAAAYTYHVDRSRQDRYKAAITFWEEHEPWLRALWEPKPVHTITPPVDSDYWCEGDTEYNFAGKSGGYNVVMTDPWCRQDVCLLPCLHAFALFRNIVTDAKLHIYAVDENQKGWSAIGRMLKDNLGIIQKWASDLRSVYRAADMLITPHRIYTRSIREAMACGVQVVSGRDVHPENVEAFALEMAHRRDHPAPNRELARALFDPTRAAKQIIDITANGN